MNKKIAIGGLTLAVIGLLSFQALKTTELNTLSASLRTSLSTAFAGYSEDVEETGKVGIGTSSPESHLHIAGAGSVYQVIESTDDTAAQIRLKSENGNRRILAKDSSDNTES